MIAMATKTLKRKEVDLGFINIPAKNRAELIGNTPIPFNTKVNEEPAKVDKYGRLWSEHLKNRFPLNTEVTIARNETGFRVSANEQKQEVAVTVASENEQVTDTLDQAVEPKQELVASENSTHVNILFFGCSKNMKELGKKSVVLVATSPPYFNAPFDYPDLFET